MGLNRVRCLNCYTVYKKLYAGINNCPSCLCMHSYPVDDDGWFDVKPDVMRSKLRAINSELRSHGLDELDVGKVLCFVRWIDGNSMKRSKGEVKK